MLGTIYDGETIAAGKVHELGHIGKLLTITGPAGACKSTMAGGIFAGEKVLHCYPSNVQAEDGKERFSGDGNTICGTAASLLFNNPGGHFYYSEKEPDIKNVVIDEALQQDARVLKWAKEHCEKYNIVLLTDTHQMLVPENGETALRYFEELQQNANNIILRTTYRPRTEHTRAEYYRLYDNVEHPGIDLKKYILQFPVIDYKDMPFSADHNYYTYRRAEEELIYLDHDIREATGKRNIKKGVISSKQNSNIEAPFMSQQRAIDTGAMAYLQAPFIFTITRSQGTENEQGKKSFFLLPKTNFMLYPRAIYTLISRFKDLNDLTIVLCDTPEPRPSMFLGLPIKQAAELYEDKKPETESDWEKIKKEAAEKTKNSPFYYYPDRVQTKTGRVFMGRTTPVKTNMYIRNQLKKDESAYINYALEAYKTLEALKIDFIYDATIKDTSDQDRTSFRYSLDFNSAFPRIASSAKIPKSGHIYKEYRKDKLNFFGYSGDYYTNNSIITEELARYIAEHHKGKIYFLFSTDYTTGTRYGKDILDKAQKNKQSKAKTKTLDWGTLQKPLLKRDNEQAPTCYIYDPRNVYELHMVAIKSRLAYIMSAISDFIDEPCVFITDDIRWNMKNPEEVIKFAEQHFPEMKFRVKDLKTTDAHFNSMDEVIDALEAGSVKIEPKIIYQNYKELEDYKPLTNAEKCRRYRQRKKERKEEAGA